MVDTLAPKKIFTQRELDTKLTPIGEQVLRSRARPKLLDTTPVFGTETSLLDRQAKSEQDKAQAMMSPVEEQEQNVQSSQETLDTKQTGERVKEDTPQGLVMKPISYAAKGIDDKEISGPIIVGEIGPEMIVPTGDGKISILPTKIVAGIMDKPTKKAQMGMEDVTIGSATMMPPSGPPLKTTDSQALGMMPPTGPLPTMSYGDLVSENDLDQKQQFTDAFNRISIAKNTLLGGKIDKKGQDRIYGFGKPYGSSVNSIIDKNFTDIIEPSIKDNQTLLNNLPKNINVSDISGSIRDSFKHGYTAGYFNLVQGRNIANEFGSDLGERLVTNLDIPNNKSNIKNEDTATVNDMRKNLVENFKRNKNTDKNKELIMDAYMDINNNRVGMDIADQAKENLGFKSNDKLSGENLVLVEAEFQKLYTENFINTLNTYDGDTTYSGYENLPTDKELKDLIYGEEGGPLKNRIKSLFKDKVKDKGTPKQIIRYNPIMINERKKDQQENFRETSRGNPNTFSER